jgi:hypothetical protein
MFAVLFVIFVTGPLHGGGAEVGLLRGVQAVGGLVAGVALAKSRGEWLRPACSAGVSWPLGYWRWRPGTPAHRPPRCLHRTVRGDRGALGAGTVAGLFSVIQQAAGPARTGWVSSTFFAAMAAFQVVGMLVAGAPAGHVGLAALLDVHAALYLAAGLVALAGLGRAVAIPPVTSPAQSR